MSFLAQKLLVSARLAEMRLWLFGWVDGWFSLSGGKEEEKQEEST